jgi:RNA polymerase sigma factor (TIGR02999 family)
MDDTAADLSTLLRAWSAGDTSAGERLTALVYGDLRRMARTYANRERGADSTPSSGALLHEAYVRVLQGLPIDWQDRTHFFVVLARTMRRVLIDAARARQASKRGSGRRLDTIDPDSIGASPDHTCAELCALDEVLTRLARIDPRRAQAIELRFFGGLTVDETATALGVSVQTVMRDWRLARAWLARELASVD